MPMSYQTASFANSIQSHTHFCGAGVLLTVLCYGHIHFIGHISGYVWLLGIVGEQAPARHREVLPVERCTVRGPRNTGRGVCLNGHICVKLYNCKVVATLPSLLPNLLLVAIVDVDLLDIDELLETSFPECYKVVLPDPDGHIPRLQLACDQLGLLVLLVEAVGSRDDEPRGHQRAAAAPVIGVFRLLSRVSVPQGHKPRILNSLKRLISVPSIYDKCTTG